MSLAVCLLFDRPSAARVRQLWARLEDLGVATLASHTHGRHLPHLSYAVLRRWDVVEVRGVLQHLDGGGPVSLSCQGSLVFPRGRVALAPAASRALVMRQEQVVAALAGTGADLHRNYGVGRWLPHVSVATRASAEQLAVVARTVADVVPLVLRADRATLVDSGTGQQWPLPTMP
ncbi:MAG TPA: 2'-5' RNA ligase family protein [Ruania sp.]|nr:2'-5' RNA ligase family protein [Ruania sp.]